MNDVFNMKENMLKKENDLQSKFEALKKENQELSKQLQESKGEYVALKKEIQTLNANFQNQDNVTKTYFRYVMFINNNHFLTTKV